MSATRRRPVLLLLAVLVQLGVLYLPSSPSVPLTAIPLDKVVHLAIFALPAALAPWAVRRPDLVWAVLAAHAPISELVQDRFLAQRAGDWQDVVADLLGLLAGAALATLARRR